ncbi:CDP-alcohol phosphatidyltransferase family protein [Microbispora catharanthi]|uniref:CDP-alcohol phosphatidyltransferase family protein n=1 Tax=Microbispora catharanthi TaxID=1712871 RepID=A0A5N6BZ97_9ACTN|nr:CDP-alcohol phosphatidyltransferase family protein [Microbispora catharanthi]KAB8185856.1 CDP-alcohol phosphatidyltransferase family protein [Microbispora catharanthi]
MTFTLHDVRSRTYKARDAWWTVFLVDPLAGRLVLTTANRTSITPNQITWGAFVLGLGSAWCFLQAEWPWLAAGAAVYHVSFVLDCMDGKIARLKGTGTVLGGWLDYVFDRIRVLACTAALMWGQYRATGQEVYLLLGIAVVFLDMLRYVDALQIAKVRRQMRRTLRHAYEQSVSGDPAALPASLLHEDLDTDPDEIRVRLTQAVDLQQEFRSRFSWYPGMREWLREHRIRTHLVSGIEFQMAVFIVGPLLGAVIPVTIGAAALLLLFEALIMYKLLLSSRDLNRALAAIRTSAEPSASGTPAG